MNILLLLLSSESRKDSRACQLCQSCGCSASWSHSLVPGDKRTQCLSAGGPGDLAVAAGGSGTSLPGRKGACQSRAGGSAAREGPGSRAQGRGKGSAARGKAAGLARSLGSLLLRRGAQAAWCWPGCAGVPVSGGTRPDAAPLTSLLREEEAEVAHSLRCLVAFSLVLAGAAQEEVPHQPPQKGEAVLLGVMMPQHCGSCKAGADLGREAARDHG